MRGLPLFALALVLAACGQPSGTPEAGGQASAPAAPTTTAAAAPDTPVANAIPARFHGLWDGESGTCQPDSDLRLDIAAQTIGFYESRGTVTAISEDAAADGAARISLAMEGEGDTWAMSFTLRLEGTGDSERLIVQHEGGEDEPESEALTLKRCAA